MSEMVVRPRMPFVSFTLVNHAKDSLCQGVLSTGSIVVR